MPINLESSQAYATNNNQYPGATEKVEIAACSICGEELMDGYCPDCDEEF